MAKPNQQKNLKPTTIESIEPQRPDELGPGTGEDRSAAEIVEQARNLDQQIDALALTPTFLGDIETAERQQEDQPQPPSNRKPAAPEDLRDQRTTYPAKPAAKCGPTVQSLSKADRGNRTRQDAVLVVCPEHHTPCYSGSSTGIYTHMYCPVEKCNWKHKLVLPTTAQKIYEGMRRNDQLSHPQQDIQPR